MTHRLTHSRMHIIPKTIEAGIVQLFVEAKRLQPSIIYIPSLPVGVPLFLRHHAVRFVSCSTHLPLPTPSFSWPSWMAHISPSLEMFVRGSAPHARTASTSDHCEFQDRVKRKKRVLEESLIAPPLEPRKPMVAELAVQEEQDVMLITLLRNRLALILTELKRKFKRFTKRAVVSFSKFLLP